MEGNYTIAKRKSIREQAYDHLKELIVNGTIPPGERIKEIEYSEKFQISRTPLREALRMLELEGLVETSKSGGVMVRKMSYEEIYEIYRIRLALENVVLEEVIKVATDEDIANLEDIMKKTGEAIEKDANGPETFALFSEFNGSLYKISKLKRIVEMINNINLYLSKIRKLAVNHDDRRLRAFDDHQKIVASIKKRDVEEALAINKSHLEISMGFINTLYGEN